MTLHERFGHRDLTYSAWHRPASIGRYLPAAEARHLTYIDVDAVETCDGCSEPLALLELARDVGQAFKQTRIMVRLAERAQVPAGLVFYKVAEEGGDILRFRVRAAWPRGEREHLMTPAAYAAWLQSLRGRHRCDRSRGRPQRRPAGRRERRRPLER